MVSPTISLAICTGALIVLIFTMQSFYFIVVDNVWAEMATRELKEIADYVSDTLANMYFLVNSTSSNVTIEKTLSLPSNVRDSTYIVEIVFDEQNLTKYANVHFKVKSRISATSWLLPGLKVDRAQCEGIESGEKIVVAGCRRVNTDFYVWIKEA